MCERVSAVGSLLVQGLRDTYNAYPVTGSHGLAGLIGRPMRTVAAAAVASHFLPSSCIRLPPASSPLAISTIGRTGTGTHHGVEVASARAGDLLLC